MADPEVVFSFPFVILFLVVPVAFIVSEHSRRRVKQAEISLTADELKTFNDRYRQAHQRDGMPSRFAAIVDATDRARRAALASAFAVLLAICFVIFMGGRS